MTENTLFTEAENKYLADIVSLTSEEEAKIARDYLMDEFNSAETNDKKLRVKRATIMASNRAYASTHRQAISEKEREEMRKIGDIYKDTYKKMKIDKNV